MHRFIEPRASIDAVGYSYVVLFSQLLAQRCAHNSSSNAGWGAEVRFARLPPRGVEG